ncbi:hypothetical protein SK128_020247, partial [Halocaridina rubra]
FQAFTQTTQNVTKQYGLIFLIELRSLAILWNLNPAEHIGDIQKDRVDDKMSLECDVDRNPKREACETFTKCWDILNSTFNLIS